MLEPVLPLPYGSFDFFPFMSWVLTVGFCEVRPCLLREMDTRKLTWALSGKIGVTLDRESTEEVAAPPWGIVADLQRRSHLWAARSHSAELGVEVHACSSQGADVGGSIGRSRPTLASQEVWSKPGIPDTLCCQKSRGNKTGMHDREGEGCYGPQA